MKRFHLLLIVLGILVAAVAVLAHSERPNSRAHRSEKPVRSTPGENPWNQGQPPEDWWGATKRMHGHVGPWNVFGWRIGQAALREFDTEWGRHELDIVCYIPLSTPYSCMADGLVIGTGNSIGRLDIRLAEVMSVDLIHVAIRRKDETGPIVIFRARSKYLEHIKNRPAAELEELSRQCSIMKESDLFQIERITASESVK